MTFKEVIGKGARATVYKIDNYAVKLFNINYNKSEAFYEALITSIVENSGLPIAKVTEVLNIDGHIAIKMDYIKGSSLSDIISGDKSNAALYINKMAELQMLVHSKKLPLIFNFKDKLKVKIKNTFLDKDKKEKLFAILSSLPDGNTLCHGDFHGNNIICSEDQYYIIDWIDASNGCPAADVCRTYMIYCFYSREAAGLYLAAYCDKSGLKREEVFEWLPVVAAARLSENYAPETEQINEWILNI